MNKYEKYQLEWMIAHGYSLNDLVKGLDRVRFSDLMNFEITTEDAFDEWQRDDGFNGEIWACEAEFNECKGAE